MHIELISDAAQRTVAGLAHYLDDEMRVYNPVIYRKNKMQHLRLDRKYEYYWIVRSACNYLLHVGRRSDFVLGIAVASSCGIVLTAFTHQFELSNSVDRSNAYASYKFYATKAYDEQMGDIWVVKIEQEKLNEMQCTAA